MGINRRNVLLGLGTIVGGGGALIGTGAFSSVSAARSVSVSTAGDSSALVKIEGDGVNTSTTDGVLSVDLGSGTGLNREAITKYTGVITVTNNAADGATVDVGLDTDPTVTTPSSGQAKLKINAGTSDAAVVTFTLGDGSVQSLDASSGTTSKTIDVSVDTRDTTVTSSGASEVSELVIVADDTTA